MASPECSASKVQCPASEEAIAKSSTFEALPAAMVSIICIDRQLVAMCSCVIYVVE